MEKSPKKWSLGNILFRKSKKDIPQADFSSDEDDFKAGFGNEFITKKSPSKMKNGSVGNKQTTQAFNQQQYSVANPEFHFYKPSQQQQQQPYNQQQQSQYQRPMPQIYQNQNNLEFINNQINLEKSRATTLSPQYIYNTNNNYLQYQGSSQDEKSSYNSLSSPINKSSSENGSRTSLNKKTRSARNERYYQRIMRDDGRPLTVYGSVNSIENNQKYQLPLNGNNRLSASLKSSSICSSDFVPSTNQMLMTQSQSLPVTRGVVFRDSNNVYDVDCDKDDYENIHEVEEPVPPPIPPRDPNRRFSINSASVSQNPYYFDHALQKYVIFNMNGKCYSDEKLWSNNMNERPKSARAGVINDRQDKQEHDILRPRSRKPLNVHTNLDNECVFSSEDVVDNPRYPISQRSKSAIDFEKMMAMNESNQIRNKYYAHKQRNLTSVEPIKYQQILTQQPQQQQRHANEDLQALRKKYSSAEDVNRNKVNMRQKQPTTNVANMPSTRKSLNEMDLKVKENSVSANLDDAINELELMYKHLVKDENLMERAARRDLPTPTKFTQLMRKYEEYENEENRNDKEPDIVLDDVFSRNLKHANQKLKIHEHQPPFGIPNKHLYPIPPKPAQDYLSVEPPPALSRKSQITAAQNNPDLIGDDLAVRNLRKDNPNYSRRRNLIEIDNNHFMKRNHTLSSLSELIYNDILKDSTKASGGVLEKYSQYEIPNNKSGEEKDVKSKLYLVSKDNSNKSEREDFEKSLNELVIESKAISQKLEKDLSKLKRESVMSKPTAQQHPKTLVNLLDFRKSMEREREKKSPQSDSPIKSSQPSAVAEPERPQMTSTACSPIKDIQDICPPKEEIIKSQAPKQQKAEKIENLIKMFNTTTLVSPEPAKKAVLIEKPSRKLSDLSNMFERAHGEVDTKPPTQPSSQTRTDVKKTTSSSSIDEKSHSSEKKQPLINPRIVSPTVMSPKMASSKVVITQKVITPIENNNAIKADVESNINNIKELIQQIKLTEFEKNVSKRDAMKPDILKSAQSDLPDYDNIKDDYEMTDCGKLERIALKPTVIQATLLIKPDFPAHAVDEAQQHSPEIENDTNSPEIKSITTTTSSATSATSSSLRETSVESSSKSSIEPIVVVNNNNHESKDESIAIYKDAIEFLQESVDQKVVAVATSESDHKSPIKSINEDKEMVLNYIDKINENLESVKNNSDEQQQQQPVKMSVKESVSKLEEKILLSRQNSEATSVSEASQYNTPSKEPSTPTQIKPVVLPKVGPSDTESLYNSSEELSMIFGHGEQQQQQQQNVPIHPGKIIEEDFEAEFEKIAHDDEILDDKVLDENFNVTLIDINNNSEYVDCFDNELSDITNKSAISMKSADVCDASPATTATATESDANNNSLTNDLNSTILELEKKLLEATAKFSHNANSHNSNSNNNHTSSNDSCIVGNRAVMCKYHH